MTDCICEGNWRSIIAENQQNFGRIYRADDGKFYIFSGILWGDDDFYYCMSAVSGDRSKRDWPYMLLSCVGSLTGEHGFGFELVEDFQPRDPVSRLRTPPRP